MNRLLSILTLLLFSVSVYSQSWEDYLYYETYYHGGSGTLNGPTYFMDISDSGMVVGYYSHESGGNVGLIRFKNGVTDTFALPGYTHTEIIGINNKHQLIGRAYNTPSSAVAFVAEIQNNKVVNASEVTWHSSGALNKWPIKINDDGIGSGSMQTGTTRWLHYMSMYGGTTTKTTRQKLGSSFVNTYGQGINESLDVVGYYIDGGERVPFVYQTSDDKIYPLNHVYDKGIGRTIFNDINENNQIAVEYRDSTGFMHSTIGQYDETNHSITYYDTFPLNYYQSTYIKGINNNGDIVGYYTTASGETRAFYASKSAMELKGFDIRKNAIPHVNGPNIFQSDTNDYNYKTGDPYFKDTVSFYDLLQPYVVMDSSQNASMLNGRRSPSWVSYVLAKGADKCYTGGQLKMTEALKWFLISSDSFLGFCNGISGMTGQLLRDTQSVYQRFPLIKRGSTMADYNLTNNKFDLTFRESLGALQFYQLSGHFRPVSNAWGRQVKYYQDGQNAIGFPKIKDYVTDIAQDFYDTSSVDSLNVLFIFLSFFQNANPGGHAIFPYKVHRRLNVEHPVDTVYVMDPNFPQQPIKLALFYNEYYGWAFDTSNNWQYNILTAGKGGNFSQIAIPNRAQLRQSRKEGIKDKHAKASTDAYSIATNGLCDFTVENVDNASEKLELKDGKYTSTISTIQEDYIMNSDDIPDVLNGSTPIKIKATLSGCEGRQVWHYMHESGDFIYARKDVKPGEEDVILHDGKTMVIQNNTGVKHDIRLTSIMVEGDEEASLSIDGFQLANNDAIKLDAVGIYKVKLDNTTGDQSNYNLNVRYISENEVFTWETTGIDIKKEHTHTILLKPEVTDKEVVILVDTTGNGVTDDTLVIENKKSGIKNVEDLFQGVDVFPNPVAGILHLNFANQHVNISEITLRNIQDNVVYSAQAIDINHDIDMSDLTAGVYFLELVSNDGLRSTKKIVKL